MSAGVTKDITLNNELIDRINSEDYIKNITDLADETEIVTSEDVFTRTLHKLIAGGTKIDSSFYERLVKHKLLKPIDNSLRMLNGINSDSLIAESLKIIRNERIFSRMFVPYGDLPFQMMRNVHFEAPISLKMSIIKEAMPRLFNHSVKASLIAVFIGLKEGILHRDIHKLATAAMFHDISELHINPELQDPKHKMTDEDWSQIYAHPVVSYLILKEFPAYNPEISQAVIDHHEKLDGSGYPRGKLDADIDRNAQIVAVAETIAALVDKGYSSYEIEAKMKMSQGQYNKTYLYHVLSVLKDEQTGGKPSEQQHTLQNIDKKTSMITGIIKKWQELMEKLNKQQKEQMLVGTIDDRVEYLQKQLADSGIDINQQEQVYFLLGDNSEEWLHDIRFIIDESFFQLHQTISEAKRNWPEYKEPHKPRSLGEFLSQWMAETEKLVKQELAVISESKSAGKGL